MNIEHGAKEADSLARRIMPFFAGRDPAVIGAALADLTAIWLAAHVCPDQQTTDELRTELLHAHIEKVWELVEPNYHLYIEPKLKDG